MSMQTDVKSKYLAASGSVFGSRSRIKAISICATAASAGKLVLKDGGSGGTTVVELDIPSSTTPISFYNLIPGEGVLCESDIYATLTGIASVTVYYG